MHSDVTVFLTNIPAPYRESVHEHASRMLNNRYTVLYCSPIEINRKWKIDFGDYERKFLNSKSFKFAGRTIYLTSDIWRVLKEISPDVVVIGGFSVPMLIAYFWAITNRRNVISFTDANLDSESKLSIVHKVVRYFFYKVSDACIGASQKSRALYIRYGVSGESFFQSHLCANNNIFPSVPNKLEERNYDIMLCGQMIPGKMFDFSLDVISVLLKNNQSLKVKVLGSGPLKDHLLTRLEEMGVHYDYPGFVSQIELPKHYSDSRVFLFPSAKDAWGVVANEACAAGTPVITCPVVGAAGELIVDGVNGFVVDTKIELWASKVQLLLQDRELWQKMSEHAKKSVSSYTYENAAKGIVDAVNYVRSSK